MHVAKEGYITIARAWDKDKARLNKGTHAVLELAFNSVIFNLFLSHGTLTKVLKLSRHTTSFWTIDKTHDAADGGLIPPLALLMNNTSPVFRRTSADL